MLAAAHAAGQRLVVLDASTDPDIEAAFPIFVERGAGALFVGSGAFLNSNRERLGGAGGPPCAADELSAARGR